MKNFIITIKDIERSEQTARRCIKSGIRHGMNIETFDAITPRNTNVYRMMEAEELDTAGFIEHYSRLENCIAAFLSHYSLWKKCIEDKVTYTIFEHDAFILQPISDTLLFDKQRIIPVPTGILSLASRSKRLVFYYSKSCWLLC